MLPAFLALSCCGPKPAGKVVYGPHCGICHHGGGGMPGEIPPLVGRLDLIASTPEGRHYLVDVILDGLRGPFVTQGYRYDFSMPPFRRLLDDQQVADVLNWLIERGDSRPAPRITPQEVARARAQPGHPAATYHERQILDGKYPLP
ncbi:c-type cytochrome [Gluconobacter morbifer]|nr:c-type cytochrome [Gluconobacter morbifer]